MDDEFRALEGALVEAFYPAEDPRCQESLRELRALEATEGLLPEVTGLRDAALLDRLAELGVGPVAAVALTLTPPILSAWADGSVAASEWPALVEGIKNGLFFSTVNRDLAEAWLDRRPGPVLEGAWSAFARALASRLGAPFRDHLASEVLASAERVARSSGSLLSGGRRSPAEAAVLDRLRGALA